MFSRYYVFKPNLGNPYHKLFKMVREDKATWKSNYFTKIEKLLEEFPRCFIVSADNVGSRQMQQIRIALRGKAEVLMGKNTMMRKAIRGQLVKFPGLEKLVNLYNDCYCVQCVIVRQSLSYTSGFV